MLVFRSSPLHFVMLEMCTWVCNLHKLVSRQQACAQRLDSAASHWHGRTGMRKQCWQCDGFTSYNYAAQSHSVKSSLHTLLARSKRTMGSIGQVLGTKNTPCNKTIPQLHHKCDRSAIRIQETIICSKNLSLMIDGRWRCKIFIPLYHDSDSGCALAARVKDCNPVRCGSQMPANIVSYDQTTQSLFLFQGLPGFTLGPARRVIRQNARSNPWK
jgi:hypothetical protein